MKSLSSLPLRRVKHPMHARSSRSSEASAGSHGARVACARDDTKRLARTTCVRVGERCTRKLRGRRRAGGLCC
jgi:hypothetical protein